MWDENHVRRRRHRHGPQKSNKAIHITFFVFHATSVLLGSGLFVVAHLTQVEERNTMGDIELHVTAATALIYSICGGVLIFTVIVGSMAQFFRKSYLFLVYCVLMSIITLAQFSAAGTSFGSMSDHDVLIQSLKELMMEYGNSNHKDSAKMTLAWDYLQKKYECCGVNNYTDWQSVDFGLTSLKVPTSCCLKNLDPSVVQYCGQNMLPDNDDADKFIYVNGCLGRVTSQLDFQLFILGVFGLIVGFFTIITIVFACFLVITKRV